MLITPESSAVCATQLNSSNPNISPPLFVEVSGTDTSCIPSWQKQHQPPTVMFPNRTYGTHISTRLSANQKVCGENQFCYTVSCCHLSNAKDPGCLGHLLVIILPRYKRKTCPDHSPNHPWDKRYIYLHVHAWFFSGFHVGKYAIVPWMVWDLCILANRWNRIPKS